MKSSEVDLSFPVLGFTADGEIWGFPDLDRLTKCGRRTIRERLQDGMELIDAKGCRWRVLSVQRTGRAGSILNYLIGFGPPQSRIEQHLELLSDLPIDEVQGRTLQSLQGHATDYMGFEGDENEFRSLKRKLSRARTVTQIYDLLQPDTFESY